MKIDEVDFSPLNNLSKARLIVNAYIYVFKNRNLYLGVGIFVLLGVINYALIELEIIDIKNNFLAFIIIFGTFLFNAYVIDSYTDLRKKYWYEFARINGWSRGVYSKKFIPPSIFHVGVNRGVFDFSIKAEEWVIIPYQYETSHSRNSRKIVNTILYSELPKHLPYIAIDSVKNSGGLMQAPRGFETIELEGDMNKHFIVSVQKGLYTDALSILSPDVMAVLITHFKEFDVEIVDNALYVLATNDQRTDERMKNMLIAGEKLRKELLHRIRTLNFESGKKFEYRGQELEAITKLNAKYRKSYVLELKRTRWQLKAMTLLLFIVFLVLVINYIKS